MRTIARSVVAIVVLTGAMALSAPAVAHGHNCSDYSTSAEATSAMAPGDPDNLDADDDGVACESLPAGSGSSGDSSGESDDDATSGMPSGGVDAGLGGAAGDDQAVSLGMLVLGAGLVIGGAVMWRRRTA